MILFVISATESFWSGFCHHKKPKHRLHISLWDAFLQINLKVVDARGQCYDKPSTRSRKKSCVFTDLIVKALYTLENWSSNFVTTSCHITHKSDWQCVLYQTVVKILLYPFLNHLKFSLHLVSTKTKRKVLKLFLSYIIHAFIFFTVSYKYAYFA